MKTRKFKPANLSRSTKPDAYKHPSTPFAHPGGLKDALRCRCWVGDGNPPVLAGGLWESCGGTSAPLPDAVLAVLSHPGVQVGMTTWVIPISFPCGNGGRRQTLVLKVIIQEEEDEEREDEEERLEESSDTAEEDPVGGGGSGGGRR